MQGTPEEWVWDYENNGDDTIQPTVTEPKGEDNTKDDEDMTTGPGLDLDKVIAKKDVQCQNTPTSKTNETSTARAVGLGVSETGQLMGACKMDAMDMRADAPSHLQQPKQGTRDVPPTSNDTWTKEDLFHKIQRQS